MRCGSSHPPSHDPHDQFVHFKHYSLTQSNDDRNGFFLFLPLLQISFLLDRPRGKIIDIEERDEGKLKGEWEAPMSMSRVAGEG